MEVWPKEAYSYSTRPCFLCGNDAPYWCNHCVNREDAEATDFRLHLEQKWGNPLPIARILAGGIEVICPDCWEEATNVANGTTI